MADKEARIMTSLKEFEGTHFQCLSCAHNEVCSVKSCMEETKFETTHPYVIVKVECQKYMPVRTDFIK